MQLQKIISQIKQQQPIPEKVVKRICKKVQQILVNESNLQPISSPINIVGDVHGQFYDVLKIFQIGTFILLCNSLRIGGQLPHEKYLFIGDFVDRGYNSVETILLLFCLKIQHPEGIYLTRGNHESRQISCMYGFHEQCNKKYGNPNVWKYCNDTFDYLPIGAIIDNEIFCVHGGLSPDIHTLDQIRELNRRIEIPTQGPFADLMWSDPEQIDTWSHGSRGAGWLFGYKVVNEFNYHNGLELIVRAHQLAQEGYTKWFEKENLVTVWSAPNYCYRCNNLASILKVEEEWRGRGSGSGSGSGSGNGSENEAEREKQLENQKETVELGVGNENSQRNGQLRDEPKQQSKEAVSKNSLNERWHFKVFEADQRSKTSVHYNGVIPYFL